MMRKPINTIGIWCATIVVASTLVGVWKSQEPIVQPLSESDPRPDLSLSAQIEAELAMAGCPGWMVLASEGENALQGPPAKIVPEHILPTSNRISQQVPSVRYPVPVRVASRPPTPGSGNSSFVTVGSPDDPDDLLDGMPDLLFKPNDPKAMPEALPSVSMPKTTPVPLPAPSVNQPKPEPAAPKAYATPAKDDLLDGEPDLLDLPPAEKPPSEEAAPQPMVEPAFPAPAPPVRTLPPTTPGELPAPKQPQLALPSPIAEEIPAASPRTSPFAPPPAPSAPATTALPAGGSKQKNDSQSVCEFIADSQFPSAEACSKCHQRNYDEWSISGHAYAMVSPMFHKFEQKINDLSLGTIGYFCYRCHSPVGVSLGISRAAPLWELPLVAREGVTCVACHRVNERYGKVNGERRIEPGGIHAPIYGPFDGNGVAEVIAKSNQYKVKNSPHVQGPGQDIHAAGFCFDQLSKSEFCVSCHQVAVHPGIKLEVVWEQYRASPACKKGISCQDCHMGRIPGVASGYEIAPAAKVNDKIVNPNRKHANHSFFGPGYSIAHPGIFPHNPKSRRWSISDWLMFDHRAGWGTDEFEESLERGQIHAVFPPAWAEVDDRYDAREVVNENLKKLAVKDQIRHQLMENGSHVDGPYFDSPLVRGSNLRFHYVMTNTNEGHNLPTGSLGAQPQLWANVVLIGPRGQRLWESGYTDRWGDVADIHSEDVRNKRIPFDTQLFNLQTMFLITGAKGTDREFFLPVNIDFDQLPFLRPGAQPISVINHPPFIRMEGRSLPPLGSRKIPYKIPANLLQEPGNYRLSFRLRSRLEPIYFMRFVGATREMQRAMNEGILDFHQSSVEFLVR